MSQHAEICPVCEGKTTMPASFYVNLAPASFYDRDEPVECRSCHGTGYVVIGIPDVAPWPSWPSWPPQWAPQLAPYQPYNPIVWFSTDTETTAAPSKIGQFVVTSDRSHS